MRVSLRLATAVALFSAACSDSGGPKTPLAPSATVAALSIVSGNNQSLKAGERSAIPLVVRVTDGAGNGVGNIDVSFKVTTGSGGLLAKSAAPVSADPLATTISGPDGSAFMTVLPFEVGPLSVAADVPGSAVASVNFAADVTDVVIEFRSPQSSGNYASFVGPCRCHRMINTVTVQVGTAVEWKSIDDGTYTVTSRSAPSGGAAFDSGPLGRSSRFRFVPNTAGIWEYLDTISGLTATLIAR